MGAETAEEESEEPVVPAELYKTATEAQAHGEPYFLYREETTGETNAMPVKKQPLQYVPKHLDWYCTICRYWVDDEQDVCVPPPPLLSLSHSSFCVPSLTHCSPCGWPSGQSIVCSHDDCEDVYHLRCTGLKALPEGDWYCPPPGCVHARGAVIAGAVAGAAPCAHRWDALPPLRVGARRYRRVLCDGARVYYALTPLARDVTGLAGRALAAALRTAAGYPDRVYVRERVFPHDVARLRALRLMNAATHARALVTADALLRAFRACPVPRVQRQLAALRAALAADTATAPVGPVADPPAAEGAVGMKRAREEGQDTAGSNSHGAEEDDDGNGDEDEEDEEGDLDEEMACAPHPVLDDIVLLQEQVAQFRAVVAGLEGEVAALKKAVAARMAAAEAAAAAEAVAAPDEVAAPPPQPQLLSVSPQQQQQQQEVLPALPPGIPAQTVPQLQQQQQQPVRWQ